QKYKSFFWAFFFTLIVFMYFRAKDYYAIGLYPIYISFGSVFLADFLKNGWKQNLRPIALAIPILFFIPIYQIAFPNKSPDYIVQNSITYKKYGLLRWEDGKDHSLPQDYADMLGWEELARKVDSVYIKLPKADQTLVLCDNYGQAGAINYYTKQHIKAVSFNADYVNWFNFDRQYINLIRIKDHAEKDNELIETSPYFNLAYVADSITNPYAREFKTLIFAFIGAKVDVNKRIKNEIEETKNYR
ncbi:MAG: glycosyl transferase, partial [Arenibacter sp.]